MLGGSVSCYFTEQFISDLPVHLISKIFGHLIPLKVEFDYARKLFYGQYISDQFEPVDETDLIPYYTIAVKEIKRATGKIAYRIFFIKLGNS